MITSFLFNSDNGLDTYRNDHVIQGLLGSNFVLLNLEEFLDWYEPDVSRQPLPRVAAAQNPFAATTLRRQVSHDEKLFKAIDVLPKLASLCRGIGEDYGEEAVKDLLDKNASFDLLVALQGDYDNVDTLVKTKTLSKRKLDKVVAFIIVELGECKDKPQTVSVKLICGKSSTPQFKASILLGAYLYCIKKTNYDQEGILELAGGYTNPSGFMSYTKLGFNYDKRLYGPNCFKDFGNLPMSVNLVKMSSENIINLVGDVTTRKIDNIDDPTMLYKLKGFKDTKKNELILLQNISNILYRLELNGREALKHYTSETDPFNNPELTRIEQELISKYMTNLLRVNGKINIESLRTFITSKKDRLIESFGVDCADGVCNSTIRCINGICNFLGRPDAFGGKHKTRKYKIRKHKIRKHKTKKYKIKK